MHQDSENPRIDSRGCAIAILAGGRSKRMGRDKASVVIEGQPLLTRLVARLTLPRVPIYLVGAHDPRTHSELTSPDSTPELRFCEDAEPCAGPLAALANLSGVLPPEVQSVFVAAVDMPMLSERLASYLLHRSRMPGAGSTPRSVLPVIAGRDQLLAATWSRASLELARDLRRRGHERMTDLADRSPDLERIDEEELESAGIDAQLTFFGLNTEDDLEALEARLRL